MEKQLKKYNAAFGRGNNAVGNMIVYTVANLTVGALEALVPEVLKKLKRKGLDARKLTNLRYYIKKAASRMIKLGLIEVKITPSGKKYFELTQQGKELLFRYQIGEIKLERPKHWDGNWHIIVFDINEKRRRRRDLLRKELRNFGLLPIQKSVWVSPYDCEEVTLLLKTGLGMGKEVLYMEVGYLENDRWLRKEFGLD